MEIANLGEVKMCTRSKNEKLVKALYSCTSLEKFGLYNPNVVLIWEIENTERQKYGFYIERIENLKRKESEQRTGWSIGWWWNDEEKIFKFNSNFTKTTDDQFDITDLLSIGKLTMLLDLIKSSPNQKKDSKRKESKKTVKTKLKEAKPNKDLQEHEHTDNVFDNIN